MWDQLAHCSDGGTKGKLLCVSLASPPGSDGRRYVSTHMGSVCDSAGVCLRECPKGLPEYGGPVEATWVNCQFWETVEVLATRQDRDAAVFLKELQGTGCWQGKQGLRRTWERASPERFSWEQVPYFQSPEPANHCVSRQRTFQLIKTKGVRNINQCVREEESGTQHAILRPIPANRNDWMVGALITVHNWTFWNLTQVCVLFLKAAIGLLLLVSWSPGACACFYPGVEKKPSIESKPQGQQRMKKATLWFNPVSPHQTSPPPTVYKIPLEQHTGDCKWCWPLGWDTRDKRQGKLTFH